jgi:hypothetical protein
MAAALLVGLVGLTAGYVWYENQRAEADRKEALAKAETESKQASAAEIVRESLNNALRP